MPFLQMPRGEDHSPVLGSRKNSLNSYLPTLENETIVKSRLQSKYKDINQEACDNSNSTNASCAICIPLGVYPIMAPSIRVWRHSRVQDVSVNRI